MAETDLPSKIQKIIDMLDEAKYDAEQRPGDVTLQRVLISQAHTRLTELLAELRSN